MPSSWQCFCHGFALFIYTQFCRAPSGMVEAQVLDSQPVYKGVGIISRSAILLTAPKALLAPAPGPSRSCGLC